MLLDDISNSPSITLKKINRHLKDNYGLTLAENASSDDLNVIMEQIQDEITELKLKGDDAKSSAEISKRLLILEGLTNLKETEMVNIKSPKLDFVINSLVEYVVDAFEISGYHGMPEFDKAMDRAMDEYRSSRYRFPDEMIEQRVRQEALNRIKSGQAEQGTSSPIGSGIQDEPDVAAQDERSRYLLARKKLQDLQMDPNISKDPEKRFHVMGMTSDLTSNAPMHEDDYTDEEAGAPESDEIVPMARNSSGQMAPAVYEGKAMKEHQNLVKNLRRLLETEVSQAEVMMAAKGFAQELQEMVEKIGRLQNEDLPPVTDQMRETYGMESASAFQTQIYGALQGVMDSLYTAKNQVDDAVSNMASTGQVGAQTDMDKDMGMAGGDEMGGDEMGGDDLDNIAADIGDEAGLEQGDDFGGAEEEEPLGRAMKESILKRKVLEMQRLVAKARQLRETNGSDRVEEMYSYKVDKSKNTDVLSRRNTGMKHPIATDPEGYKHMRKGQTPNATPDQKRYGDMYPLGGPKGHLPENKKK